VIRDPIRDGLAAMHRRIMAGALELHLALARGLARLSFGVARTRAHLTSSHRGDISGTRPSRKLF